MAALDARGDFPGPAWIGMEQDPSILGAPFLVMGKVDGRAATQKPNYNVDGWLVDLSPEERGDVWRHAIHAFAKLHRIDWRDGFEFLNQPEDRKSVVQGQCVSVRVDLGGRRVIKKKKTKL